MTTTIDIPEDLLDRAMRMAGSSSPQELVVKALEEFLTRHDQRDVIPLLGTFEDFITPDEVDQMRSGE